MKNLLMIAIATFGLAAITMAQVPNYVPSNGLVGWWPFNGNANDESGNGNNGIVNGAILTTDINSNSNAAYYFDGVDDNIAVSSLNNLQYNPITYSFWFNPTALCAPQSNECWSMMLGRDQFGNLNQGVFTTLNNNSNGIYNRLLYYTGGDDSRADTTPLVNTWYHLVFTYDNAGAINWYLNNTLISVDNLTINSNANIQFNIGSGGNRYYFNGKIDDIGIWNRVLTQQEITNLYNAVNCTNNTAITPQINSLTTGSTATFTASTTDPNPTYVWQSDLGQGFQTLNNFGNYSGVNTASLNVTNVQLSEHNQPIRVISTSGNCIDTSNVAVINILDTCITNVTIYDTILTTVTDTLIINATITGLNPPSNQNTLKVFPNPANTHITIDYGNFSSMNGYTLKIVNATGQTVFTTFINQQNSYIDLSTWTGNGIYYVQLIDTQNNTIENRKIVIH